MTNLRLDDRSPLHPTGSGATLSGMNVAASQPQTHRTNSNQQSQQQPQHQQQRTSRGGLVQRGIIIYRSFLGYYAILFLPEVTNSLCMYIYIIYIYVCPPLIRWRKTWRSKTVSIQWRPSTIPWKFATQRVRTRFASIIRTLWQSGGFARTQ